MAGISSITGTGNGMIRTLGKLKQNPPRHLKISYEPKPENVKVADNRCNNCST
jgi:hypothetical protein